MRPPRLILEGVPAVAPINVTPPAAAATASAHDGNLPGNTVDGNLSTADWSGRYVRVVGHGNSVNTFNSITEVAIFAFP